MTNGEDFELSQGEKQGWAVDDVEQVRADFPLIQQAGTGQANCGLHATPENEGLVYLDNAATMQRPEPVIQAVRRWGLVENANPLRGLYDLSVGATKKLARARRVVANFMGASEVREVIFTRGTTEGLNLVAMMLSGAGRSGEGVGEMGQNSGMVSEAGRGLKISSDDEIVVEVGAHHSNLLPWLELARRTGARLKVAKCGMDGVLKERGLAEILTPNTKVVALSAMSNVTGAMAEVGRLVKVAHEVGAIVVVDAAQAVAHMKIDVREWGADLVAWSGHKIGAPMGVGVLWGRYEILEQLRPVMLGGEMVEGVSLPGGLVERGRQVVEVNLAEIPQRFEAGTLNMDGVVGLMVAIEYWERIGNEKIWERTQNLTSYVEEKLTEVDGVQVLAAENGIISFKIEGVHPHDVAEILSGEGIAVRAGYHCAQPLLEYLGWGPVVRASLAMYNTEEEIDKMVEVVGAVRKKMGL